MPDILIRGLDAETVRKLKRRARRHHRSLQGEAKSLIKRAAGIGGEEIAAVLDQWQRRFSKRRLVSSAELIREDRKR